ncbi:MAG: glycosyltransferase [Spirochaetaceae bacterium]|jgi:UDP:flavonoid glycosyltransferase YjiC (YdhE family)|nr:glycosyltransferase [Spirochaetaceae bacterium]
MKILLVTRGSQGDIYPYLRLSQELLKRGHTVTINLPLAFERHAKECGLKNISIQGKDDITGLMEEDLSTNDLLKWTYRVIDQQFKELPPLLKDHDVLVASNTEFGAPTIAEYCQKPYLRTAYGPFIPGKKIPPPVFPWPHPNPVIRPSVLWGALNAGLNLMVKKTLNVHRARLGLYPIKDQSEHAPTNAINYLMYSPSLGSTDPDWKYKWKIGGYIFNDNFSYDEDKYNKFMDFVNKDSKPLLFFTLGSCNSELRDQFAFLLDSVCKNLGCKLAVGSGWHEVGAKLQKHSDLFLLDGAVPHCKIFPHANAIIHHGGVGTVHNAARFGKPQILVPLFLDQWYWSYQLTNAGVSSGKIDIKKITEKMLYKKVEDLLNNDCYKTNAEKLSALIQNEDGLTAMCSEIEKMLS